MDNGCKWTAVVEASSNTTYKQQSNTDVYCRDAKRRLSAIEQLQTNSNYFTKQGILYTHQTRQQVYCAECRHEHT